MKTLVDAGWELTKLTAAWVGIGMCVYFPILGVTVLIGTLLYAVTRD